jgi:2,5-dioxopentanoate dehydrogenase
MTTQTSGTTWRPILLGGEWQFAATNQLDGDTGPSLRSIAAATGEVSPVCYPVSDRAQLQIALAQASDAAAPLAALPASTIAEFLELYANQIVHHADALVATAHRETGLPVTPRLASVELPRTVDQLRQGALAARSYSWTAPVIDTKANIRASFGPSGKPVAIFGPNNFPMAFNAISGSDFVCAIVARSPVIAKAHPGHLETSFLLAQIAHAAALACGLPKSAIQMLYHLPNELGLELVGDSRLSAFAFTGSRASGLALKAAADAAGVAAFLELSSVNPVFVLPGAAAERSVALAQELFASSLLGSGQFCTKPGIIALCEDAAGTDLIRHLAAQFQSAEPLQLLNQQVALHCNPPANPILANRR